MSRVLEGLEGIVCQIDDVLIYGTDQTNHDARLKAALTRLEQVGVTLNEEKCSFSQSEIKFLGHIINEQGVSADPEKTVAIKDMKAPTNVSEMRRFLGMVNQLGKFSPNVADYTQPLRDLLRKKNDWVWGPEQKQAFQRIKQELTQPTILALYDPQLETKISADASSFGLGSVLLQRKETEWRPVAYASRSMTETEHRYAQIEKEALASVWSCEKFQDYILGKKIIIETDHKPLVPLLNCKQLDCLPPRVLRFRLRLARFCYQVEYVPGKYLYTADTLSRVPLSTTAKDDTSQQEMEQWISAIVQSLPASQERLQEYGDAQRSDCVCSQVIKFCSEGWPRKNLVNPELKPYWEAQHKISMDTSSNLLLYGSRIIVPISLQEQTLNKIHLGHQGLLSQQIVLYI